MRFSRLTGTSAAADSHQWLLQRPVPDHWSGTYECPTTTLNWSRTRSLAREFHLAPLVVLLKSRLLSLSKGSGTAILTGHGLPWHQQDSTAPDLRG